MGETAVFPANLFGNTAVFCPHLNVILLTNYFIDPEATTIEEAIQSIDLRQVGVAFITGLIPGGRFVKSAAAAAGAVIINYLDALSNCEAYTPEQAVFDFFWSMGLELAGEAVVGAVAKFGKNVVAFGLRNAGFDELAERVLRNSGDAVDDKADDVFDGPNACSFSEDTPVLTDDGLIPIGEIVEGEEVLAYNEATGEIDYYPVIAVWSHEDLTIVHLTINGETIETTPEHPFHTASGAWLPAAALQIGDQIHDAAWGIGTVQAITFTTHPQTMYNFTVATAHTYFVGDGQWLVHNACGFAPGTAKSALTPDRLQHASRHLRPPEGNLLPNWRGKNGGQDFVDIAIPILENPMHTFNHTLGADSVRGFAGKVQGQWLTIFVFKYGPNAGKVASSFIPGPQQISNWGLR